MAKTVTTTSIESRNRVFGSYDVWDFLFIMIYVMLSYGLRLYVHPSLRIPFFVFTFIVAFFLTSKSSMNKRRKNYESLYFLITADLAVYRPFLEKSTNKKSSMILKN